MIKKGILLILVLLVSGEFIYTVSANPENFSIAWWTLDGGGGRSSGDAYDLTGTIGQFDTETMAGNDYVINGGFWDVTGSTSASSHIYLPVVMR